MFPVLKALPHPVGFRIPWVPPVILAVSSVDVSCRCPSEAPPIYRLPQRLATANSPLRKSLCMRGRGNAAEDKTRDRVPYCDSARERNAVSRTQGPAAARMGFFNGLREGHGRGPAGLDSSWVPGVPSLSITPLVVGIPGAVRIESSRRAVAKFVEKSLDIVGLRMYLLPV